MGAGIRAHVGRLLVAAAFGAGWCARQVSSLPGVAGAGCAVAAAWDAGGRPAGLGVAAVFLLLLDSRRRG